VDETLSITDRAYLLYDGKILQAGTPQALADDPEVRRVYLGKKFVLRRPAFIANADDAEDPYENKTENQND
jgi:ABC-type proline/glycine betaine transport system ATPase subunit